MHWVADALKYTATTANPGNKLPHEMFYGTAAHASAHASPHTFLRPAYCRRKRPSKSSPWAESCVYLGPCIDHPSDSLRMPTWVKKVVDTRDVTWEATPHAGAAPHSLTEMPEQRGAMELGEDPDPRGTGGFSSAPTTPMPVLGMGIPHQFRVVSPMTRASDGLQPQGVVSSESPDSDSSSRVRSDATSFADGAPTPTAARTAARQLGAHMP